MIRKQFGSALEGFCLIHNKTAKDCKDNFAFVDLGFLSIMPNNTARLDTSAQKTIFICPWRVW